MTVILDGRVVSLHYQDLIRKSIDAGSVRPGLVLIQLGDDPASNIYVNSKHKMCKKLGIISTIHKLPANFGEAALLQLIYMLNHDTKVHGILVQLPLPAHIKQSLILEAINPEKDVDGFHPINIGRLAQGRPHLRPCTSYGIVKLLEYYKLSCYGKHVVVVGASNIVGRPMSLEALLAKATVTICHSATQNLEQHVRSADIIVVATGTLDPLDYTWLSSKHTVIDVGIHRLADGQIRGDLDFTRLQDAGVSSASPVPGGVGLMTVIMLMYNTLVAAKVLIHETQ
jgi:methylenetetrahydrofolate dehydrogenase (NADP+) / methenyltetrahydrofolate cyclohydrolase